MATQGKRDYYEVLGVSRGATTHEIKSAFERLAAAFRVSGKPRNIADVEEIRAIATAYRVLSHPGKRSRYDQVGSWLPKENTFTGDAWTNLADARTNWAKARELAGAILDGILAGID